MRRIMILHDDVVELERAMPKHFDDHMLADVVRCIHKTDLIPEDRKAWFVQRVLALKQPLCRTVSSCGACPSAEHCEGQIGAILNGEEDLPPAQPFHLGLAAA